MPSRAVVHMEPEGHLWFWPVSVLAFHTGQMLHKPQTATSLPQARAGMTVICCYCLSGTHAPFADNDMCFLLMETLPSYPSVLWFGSPGLNSPTLPQGRYLAEPGWLADAHFHVIQARSMRLNIRAAIRITREDLPLFPRAPQRRGCESSSHVVTGRQLAGCWSQGEENKANRWKETDSRNLHRHSIQLCLGKDLLHLCELINSLCSINPFKLEVWPLNSL